MVKEMVSFFENGIPDLLKDKGPSDSDPYIFLLFNCPQHFFKKYCDKDLNVFDFKGLNLITNLFVSCDPKLQLDEKVSNRTLEQIMEMDENQIEEDIYIRNNYSNIIVALLNHIFEHFENASEVLISDLVRQSKEKRLIKMRTEFLAAYEKLNRINKKTLEKEGKEAENYSYVDYEDFVLIFSRILKYFTGLEIKLSFTDLPNSYALSIYIEKLRS